MEKNNLEVAEPFSVSIISEEHGKVSVELPATISTKIIHDKIRFITVDPGRNRNHNIRRDVRRVIKEIGLLVSFKRQDELIMIN